MLRGLIRLRVALRAIASDGAGPEPSVVPRVLEHLRAHPGVGEPAGARARWVRR